MEKIAVVGAGTMGTGISYVFAAAGFEVVVAEPSPDRQAALRESVVRQAGIGAERGKLTEVQASALPDRIRLLGAVGELPDGLDLIVESVPEQLDLKRSVLAEAAARKPRLLASNTSSFSIDTLAESVVRPEGFCGMHFFNPVWSLRLVEVIRGTATAEAAVEAACGFAERIDKQAIVVRDVPGFATSRLDLIASLEAMRMLEDGVASAEDIDLAATLAYRHPVGPLRLSDIVGLDVRLDIAEHLASVYGARFAAPEILRQRVAAGKLGQKTGRGFFSWTPVDKD